MAFPRENTNDDDEKWVAFVPTIEIFHSSSLPTIFIRQPFRWKVVEAHSLVDFLGIRVDVQHFAPPRVQTNMEEEKGNRLQPLGVDHVDFCEAEWICCLE